MLGYALEDVENMKEALLRARGTIKSRKDKALIGEAFDLLDGLIVEGHIESDEDENDEEDED